MFLYLMANEKKGIYFGKLMIRHEIWSKVNAVSFASKYGLKCPLFEERELIGIYKNGIPSEKDKSKSGLFFIRLDVKSFEVEQTEKGYVAETVKIIEKLKGSEYEHLMENFMKNGNDEKYGDKISRGS